MSDAPLSELDVRRRRAAWRATHRGTKELDILIGTYATARLQSMAGSELDLFEGFLDVADTDLQSWLIAPRRVADDKFADLVADVRAFHGLT